MRLGLLGGSFDPVHFGHLLLAELAREACRLDAVWFVPAAVPPHKQHRQLADGRQRVEMLELAIGGHEALSVSRIELDRGGVSYTVDTLAALHEQFAPSSLELFYLMGADSLADLPTWREPRRILELCIPLVVRRHGSPEPDFDALADFTSCERLDLIRQHRVEMPVVELSSSELRRRVAAGLSIRYQTPRAVEKYIETAGLYRGESGE